MKNKNQIKKLIDWFKKSRKLYTHKNENDKVVTKEFEFNDIYHLLEIKEIEGMGYGIIYTGEDRKFRYDDNEIYMLKVPYHMFLSIQSLLK